MTVCKTLAALSCQICCFARKDVLIDSEMRLSWSEHLNAARTLELVGHDHAGTALALMGIAVLVLLQDLQQSVDACEDQPSA